jgi:RHS repeat-associated protein
MGGNTLAEGDGSGNLTAEYVYFGGKRVARIDLPANTVHYYLSDHLGSTSIVASAAGSVEEESDYYPFGTEVVVTGGANELKFTGKRRDTESQLDYFGARYYLNIFGRFSSSDPVTATPEHGVNPQRWNAYTYGMNNPLFYVDLDGRDAIAVNFLNEVPVGGHEGLIVVHSDGSATYARFGPQGGNKPFGKGEVRTRELTKVQFQPNHLPTDDSYKGLAQEVADIEGQPAGDVGFNYFKTSETDSVLLHDWIRRIKEASDKGQAPDYDVTRQNCATFCIVGLIAGHAIKKDQPVNLTPNRLFMILSLLATDNYPKTKWRPQPPKEKVTHKFKPPCGEKGQSKC